MEEWKDIPGFEGLYQASTHGRIRSLYDLPTARVDSTYKQCYKQDRILSQHYCSRGNRNGRQSKKDARVTLWKDKKPYYFLVSRLVAITWCSGYHDGFTVNHIDGDPTNNRANNLEWVTLSDNIKSAFLDGLYKTQKPITLIHPDGRKLEFSSMACASRYLGKNSGYVSGQLAKGRIEICGGYMIIAG